MSKQVEALSKFDPKDPKNIKYLICYYGNDRNEDVQSFLEVEGRQNLYEAIVDMADQIDPYQSFIISNFATLSQKISVARFLLSGDERGWFKEYEDLHLHINEYVDIEEVEF